MIKNYFVYEYKILIITNIINSNNQVYILLCFLYENFSL